MSNKICSNCSIQQSLDNFHKGQSWCKNCIRDYQRKDKSKQKAKYYKQNHKEQSKIYQQRYNNTPNGREKLRYRNRMRYYLRKGILKGWTTEEYFDKLYSTNGKCQLCDKEVGFGNLEMDHIIPISKVTEGTIYMIEDIQFLCKECNSSKSNKCNVDIEYIDI